MNEKPGMDSVSALSDKKKMGKRIKAARNRVGLSQEALGAAVGKSSVYMSNVETGKANASLETVVSIANALRVSVDAVSYTHLDVYKRQGLVSPTPQNKIYQDDPDAESGFFYFGQETGNVDVYKRQPPLHGLRPPRPCHRSHSGQPGTS